MNLLQVQLLVDAVETHSIHQTAEKHNISPQGASKAIKMLEKELGIVLIDRSTKGVKLTAQGQKLIEKFCTIQKNYEEIKQACDVMNLVLDPKMISGEIALVVTPRFADSYLNKLLFRFRERYPKIKIRVDSMSNDKIFEKMHGEIGAFDIGLVNLVNLEPDIDQLTDYLLKKNLQFISYSMKELYICGAKKTLQKVGEIYNLEKDALACPIAGYEYGGVINSCRFAFEYQINSISAQVELIDKQNVLGAYSLDEFKLHFNAKKHAYIAIDPPLTLTYGYLLNGNHQLTEPEKIFLQFLLDYFD